MKVLFTAPPKYILSDDVGCINSDFIKKEGIIQSLAIYLLPSILRENGHTVEILDPILNRVAFTDTDGIDLHDLIQTTKLTVFQLAFSKGDNIEFEKASLSNPKMQFPILEKKINDVDMVSISSTSLDWFLAKAMIERIKSIDPDLHVVVGGVHATFADEHILKNSKVDFVVRYEGEKTLPELVNAIEKNRNLKEVLGLSYKNNGNIIKTEDRPPLTIPEMEETPLPAFDLMPSNVYVKINVETSRGCKFSCVFCGIPFKKFWRGLDPKIVQKKVEHALDYTKKLYGDQKSINFLDDTFVTDIKRAENILENIGETDLGDMHLSFEARANDLLHSKIFDLCKKIPINHLLIGVESGYDECLKMLKKGTTTAQVEKCASIAKQNGFSKSLIYSTIIGFPWESKEDCLKTVDFAYHLASEYEGLSYINWLQWVPGCDLWDNRQSYGINDGMEIYDSAYWISKDLRLKVSPKLSESDYIDIKKQVDQHQFMLLLKSHDCRVYYGDAWISC